jgi:hypothetical protein
MTEPHTAAPTTLPRCSVRQTNEHVPWLNSITFTHTARTGAVRVRQVAREDPEPLYPFGNLLGVEYKPGKVTRPKAKAVKEAKPVVVDIGPDRVKELRAAIGRATLNDALTQRELADAIKVSRGALAIAERAPMGRRVGTRVTVWNAMCSYAILHGAPIPPPSIEAVRP